MSKIASFDAKFIQFAKQHYSLIARVSLFIIYFYFGFLKIIGASPAGSLAIGFSEKMGVGAFAHELFIFLAIIECVIGLLILIPSLTRLTLFVMFAHMIVVCAPLALYPEAVWQSAFIPNLEGQYIIKNAALVALAFGLIAGTQPLKT